MVWLEDASTSLVGRQNWFGWKILELVWLDKMLELVWLDKMLELVRLEYARTGLLGEDGRTGLVLVWFENTRTNLV